MCSTSRARKYIGLRHENVDSKVRFTIEPLPGDDAFDQWKDGMKAVAGLPMGIPADFRKKVWLALADNYLNGLCIDWEKTKTLAFNRKSNPEDSKLDLQIVKDLHRTGSSTFSGEDNEDDRAMLQRVLLAYARWNNKVGYCQGFNVIAAVILDVMERQEDCALKVMIYLIDRVLPESFFANNLRALFVDMAVFRELMRSHLPRLSRHLDRLRATSPSDKDSAFLDRLLAHHCGCLGILSLPSLPGGNYEPPLTNVFTMQWFLTLFATCLPKSTALRIWDAVLLEGSEILLRASVAIWGTMQDRLTTAQNADEFYTLMGDLTQDMLDGKIIDEDVLIEKVYAMGEFPMPGLSELRDKYTVGCELANVASLTGMLPPSPLRESASSAGTEALTDPLEKMALDVGMLDRQYRKLMDRQKQAHIVVGVARQKRPGCQASSAVDSSTVAVNHLFVGRDMMNNCSTGSGRSRAATSSKSPPASRGCDVVRSSSSSTSSSAKVSPTGPRGDSVTDRALGSWHAPPCDDPAPRDAGSEPHDRGDEPQSAASPWTEAGRQDSDAGDRASEEPDRLDEVELDAISDYSATDEPASEPNKSDGGDVVNIRTESNEDDVIRKRIQSDDDDDDCLNNGQRPQTINYSYDCVAESANEMVCPRLTKSLSGVDLCGARPGPADRRPAPAPVVPSTETSSRLFSPFPRQYVNRRRVDNAIRLGLYTVDDMSAAATTGPQKTTSGRSARYPHS